MCARHGKMGEEPSEQSTSSFCVATVDDSTSSEECEESEECEPVAAILDVLRANRKRKVLSNRGR